MIRVYFIGIDQFIVKFGLFAKAQRQVMEITREISSMHYSGRLMLFLIRAQSIRKIFKFQPKILLSYLLEFSVEFRLHVVLYIRQECLLS